MEEFIGSVVNYFSPMPTLDRTLLLVGGLTIFFLIEQAVPLFSINYNRTKHTLTNLFFTLTTIIVNFAMALILVKSADYVVANNFGIIQWIPLEGVTGFLVKGIIGLMLMDLIGAWLAHFIEHKVKFLWQFHVIHHTDQHVDTTTANRHHPGESVIRFAFTTAAVFIVGAPIGLIFLYQSVSLVLTQFNHSNLKMPTWLDNMLVLVICTPNMHRVHHHYRQPYSDTNYGNIFSFWDKIFGTYIVVDNSKLKYGVDTYMDKEQTESIWGMLKIPFQGHQPHIEYEKEEKL
jgi:sterol desaturase/sphingolipid hydroxylase (fatty acid hydroxylase superfamily)